MDRRHLRSTVKRFVGAIALLPVASAATDRALRRRVNIVYTHYVGDWVPHYAEFYSGSTIDRLDSDLALLKKHFEFSTLSDVVTSADGKKPSLPQLAVTFDDGFDMIRSGAAEVLEAHGVRATAFVITGVLDNENLMWRNKLSAIKALRDLSLVVPRYNDLMKVVGLSEIPTARELFSASASWPMERKDLLADRLWAACDMPPLAEFLEEHQPYFTWDGLREWCRRGHQVGLHTHSHPFCSRLTSDEVETEVTVPAELLRRQLGLTFLPLSYPFGSRLNPETERALFDSRVFNCALGIGGFATRGTPAYRLERARTEAFLNFSVFGRAMLGLPRPAATSSGV